MSLTKKKGEILRLLKNKVLKISQSRLFFSIISLLFEEEILSENKEHLYPKFLRPTLSKGTELAGPPKL